MRGFVPIMELLPVEYQADKLRRKEPKCFQCVNGCKVFEVYVCDIDLTWPKCIEKSPGYEIEPKEA